MFFTVSASVTYFCD